MSLSASGYSCSSNALLKSGVRIGARKGVRSFYEGWLYLVDIAGFVGIDRFHDCRDLFFCYVYACEGWCFVYVVVLVSGVGGCSGAG